MSLKGKTALVTGGTRGIGMAIAQLLQEKDVTVFITGTTENQISNERFGYFKVDFSDLNSTIAFTKQVSAMDIDILVNNAGINKISPFEEINLDHFARIQQVNVTAPMLIIQSVLAKMKVRKWGRIVNITSIFGSVSRELRGAYSASKFGLHGLTSALALEVARFGILANCVAPGFVETELTRNILGQKGIDEVLRSIPMGRLAAPEEIARFVAWLVSPENSYICGQNLLIDGGFTCG
jgi:3-oxoacyl-[acyl-carrier protein] reductase